MSSFIADTTGIKLCFYFQSVSYSFSVLNNEAVLDPRTFFYSNKNVLALSKKKKKVVKWTIYFLGIF